MNRDNSSFELQKHEYSFSLNSNIHDEHGDGQLLLQNESSNLKCTGFKEGYQVIGHKYDVLSDRTYFWLTSIGFETSEIGFIDSTTAQGTIKAVEQACGCDLYVKLEQPLENTSQISYCKYTTLISDYCSLTDTRTRSLNLSIHHPVFEKNIHIKHSKTGTRIFWCDDFNEDRMLDLGDMDQYNFNIDPCTGAKTPTCFKFDKLRLTPTSTKFCLKPKTTQGGGNLKLGVYEVMGAYCTVDGEEVSNYYSITNHIPIFDRNNRILSQPSLSVKTDQAIQIEVFGLDQKFDFIKIVVKYTSGLDGEEKSFVNGVYPVSTDTVTIVTDKDKALISEVILNQKKPAYEKSRIMTVSNGYLFRGGLTAHEEINLQPVVNLLGGFARWGTVQAKEDLYEDGVYVANYSGYPRDEVVPFGIQFFSEDGYEYPINILIPPPIPTDHRTKVGAGYQAGKATDSIYEYNPSCGGSARDEKWQFENTAAILEQCLTTASEGATNVVEREEETFCYVLNQTTGEPTPVDTLASGVLDLPSEVDSLASYINTNREALRSNQEAQWAAITNILFHPERYTQSCTPPNQASCTPPVLTGGEVFIIGVGTEIKSKEPFVFSEYSRLQPVVNCSYLLKTNGVDPEKDEAFATDYLLPNEFVYKGLGQLQNSSCANAFGISPLTEPQAPTSYYFSYAGSFDTSGGLESSKFSVQSQYGNFIFSNKLHKAALWFKLSFDGKDVQIFELSQILCQNQDALSSTVLRVSFFATCQSTAANTTLTRIIHDTTITGDSDKFFEVLASDFGGPNSSVYIAIDAPLLKRTDATTNRIKYLQTRPCGCFSIFKRDEQNHSRITFTGMQFGKKNIYKTTCKYSIPVLNGCDPISFFTGKFSSWESQETYPCNVELYDSSELNIYKTDLPVALQKEFEDNYVSQTVANKYYLDVNKTNFSGKKIRHYKFPDNKVSPFMSFNATLSVANVNKSFAQDPGDFNESVIYPLGFFLSNAAINAMLDIAVKNNLLTINQRVKIKRYDIVRGDRTTNKSIVAKGLLFDMLKYSDNDREILYPNYPFNSLSKDTRNNVNHPYEGKKNIHFSFHSPDTHFHKVSNTGLEMSLEGFSFGKADHSFIPVEDHSTYVLLGKKAYKIATDLALAEMILEITVQAADWLVLGSSGGLSAPVAIIAAVAAGVAFAVQVIIKEGEVRFKWIETIRNLGKPNNFAYYGVGVGQYNYFRPISSQYDSLRAIAVNTYLESGRLSVQDKMNDKSYLINNSNREDSLFLSLGKDDYSFNYPDFYQNYDNSSNSSRREYSGLGQGIGLNSNVASPYVALKQYLPSQFGSIGSIRWVNTNYCGDLTQNNNCSFVFGGDTSISRFSVKRKFQYYTSNAIGLPPLTPFGYSELYNINPQDKDGRLYIDYLTNNSDDDYTKMGFVFPSNKSYFNLGTATENDDEVYIKPPNKFYLFSYGIPYFLVESDINSNFRYAGREKFEDFYPRQKDVEMLTQEVVVPISEDERFLYDSIYSKAPTINPSRMLPQDYTKERYHKLTDLSDTVIRSKKDELTDSKLDPWTIYKPLDLLDFKREFGDLTVLEGLESEMMLAIFTDGFLMLNAVDQIKDRQAVSYNLGKGVLFEGRNLSQNKTGLGFGGSQSRQILNNEYGRFWVDAKRGQILQLGPNGSFFNNISGNISKWLQENLPFKLSKYFPNMTRRDLDNTYYGAGITLGWDNRLKRVFVTKKDYIPLKDEISFGDGIFSVPRPCPPGYKQDPITKDCISVEVTPKIPGGRFVDTFRMNSTNLGDVPPALYSTFRTDGTGFTDSTSPTGFSFRYLSAPFWSIQQPNPIVSSNRWVTNGSPNTWYGDEMTLNISTPKTYYVYLAASTDFRIKLDGVVVVESNVETMAPQHGYPTNGFSVDRVTWQQTHLYPVRVGTGCHILRVEAKALQGKGLFSAIIFDNTAAEIQAATALNMLTQIYTTANALKFSEGPLGYICPEGYTSSTSNPCSDCVKIVTTSGKQEISIRDPKYFKECSWTVAYSPLEPVKSFISYYSFKPDYYVDLLEYFQTGKNWAEDFSEIGLWSHLPFLSSYLVFYGKKYPWIIEGVIPSSIENLSLSSVQYYLQTKKYYDKYNSADVLGVGFDEAYVYNMQNNTGKLKLVPQIKNNRSQLFEYPKFNNDGVTILQTQEYDQWAFNYLFNHIRSDHSGLPVWKWDCSQIEKEIDPRLLDLRNSRKDRLRGDNFLVRFISKTESRFKMVFRFFIENRNK